MFPKSGGGPGMAVSVGAVTGIIGKEPQDARSPPMSISLKACQILIEHFT